MEGSHFDEREFFRAISRSAVSAPKPFERPGPEALARVQALAERRMSAEEFEA